MHLEFLDHADAAAPGDSADFQSKDVLLSRPKRTMLPTAAPLLAPSVAPPTQAVFAKKKAKEAYDYNRNAQDLPPLQFTDAVRIQPPTMLAPWGYGTVVPILPQRSYVVETPKCSHLRQNRRHLRRSRQPSASTSSSSSASQSSPSGSLSAQPAPALRSSLSPTLGPQ